MCVEKRADTEDEKKKYETIKNHLELVCDWRACSMHFASFMICVGRWHFVCRKCEPNTHARTSIAQWVRFECSLQLVLFIFSHFQCSSPAVLHPLHHTSHSTSSDIQCPCQMLFFVSFDHPASLSTDVDFCTTQIYQILISFFRPLVHIRFLFLCVFHAFNSRFMQKRSSSRVWTVSADACVWRIELVKHPVDLEYA